MANEKIETEWNETERNGIETEHTEWNMAYLKTGLKVNDYCSHSLVGIFALFESLFSEGVCSASRWIECHVENCLVKLVVNVKGNNRRTEHIYSLWTSERVKESGAMREREGKESNGRV